MDKMKIFLDTNVLVDFCAEREPFYSDAATIIDMGRDKLITIAISSLTLVNIAYVMRKIKAPSLVNEKIAKIAELCAISSIDRQVIMEALASQAADFEDAIQYFSAMQAEADLIITRDPKGFSPFTLPVMSPSEFLKHCAE